MNDAERLAVARAAVETAGAALLRLPRGGCAREQGDQLKTAADAAAEGWVLNYVRAHFPSDHFLAEESFEAKREEWGAPSSFWTVDALDGTRSFVDGFDGYCVQVAYVENGIPRLGVIYEPVADRTYYATAGHGAFRQVGREPSERIFASKWSIRPRFVDSTHPRGAAGEWFRAKDARFVELGSIGLKICRVADGQADVFLKALRFKLWDVAPGSVILSEAGARLGTWTGDPIPFDTSKVHFQNIIATNAEAFDDAVATLSRLTS